MKSQVISVIRVSSDKLDVIVSSVKPERMESEMEKNLVWSIIPSSVFKEPSGSLQKT